MCLCCCLVWFSLVWFTKVLTKNDATCCCVLSFWILNAWEWNEVWSSLREFYQIMYLYKSLLFYELPHKRKHVHLNLESCHCCLAGGSWLTLNERNRQTWTSTWNRQPADLLWKLVSVVLHLRLSMHSIQLPITSLSNNLHHDSNEHAKPAYITTSSKISTEWTIRR